MPLLYFRFESYTIELNRYNIQELDVSRQYNAIET
jgi:hypothetical protein